MITRVVGWAVSVFYTVERRGAPLPEGPVLVVANHLNALVDPMVLFRVAGRPTRPLAKAPLFEQVLVGGMLRGLGGLPVYRRQDDPALMGRNEDTFRAAIDALLAGDALQIYPEGKSHSEPALEPLRTGAARIALAAEAEADEAGEGAAGGAAEDAEEGAGAAGGAGPGGAPGLGLRVVPVGLTYERKQFFGGRVLAEIGAPFEVRPWLTADGAEDQAAVRGLTEEIAERLRALTLNLTEHADRPLLEAADRLWSREKGVHGFREREGMAERVPRLRRFAEALAWLRENDPERYRELAAGVRRHERLARSLGAEEGDVPPGYAPLSVLRYVLREGAALLVGLPLAALGTVLWYPVWVAPRLTLRVVRPDVESVATYKLATGFLAVPLMVLLVALAGFWLWGWAGALAAGLAAPALGLVALAWRARWGRVREDARLFLRAFGRRRTRGRMADRRAALVAAFDRVLAEMAAEGSAASERRSP
ncbi:MAG: 1-acyl-sn-glycerol-3-phosphate acyltransferase [Gemmatimonadota bacterium]